MDFYQLRDSKKKEELELILSMLTPEDIRESLLEIMMSRFSTEDMAFVLEDSGCGCCSGGPAYVRLVESAKCPLP